MDVDDDSTQTTKAISRMAGGLEIRVDPRIELISVVGKAKSFEEKHLREPTMKQEISNCFLLYKDHPAVEMMQELKTMYFRSRRFILGFSNPPELRQLYPLKQLYPHSGWSPDEETVAELIRKLRDFYNDSKFGTFYHEHRAAYEGLLDIVAAGLEKRDYAKLLEDYFGESKDGYILIYSPIISGGVGMWIETEREIIAYSIMSYGTVPIVLHEFAHTFVNPITDEFKEEICQYRGLFPPIWRDLPSSSRCYNSWQIMVNEHIIRAFTARVETMIDGEDAGRQALEREVSDGFKYIVPMYERLREYETNRDRYPDFRSFCPRIIELLAELSSKQG